MSDVIIIENSLKEDGLRRVHLMSNQELPTIFPQFGEGQVTKKDDVYHFYREWFMRGAMEIQCEGWPKYRRMVLWHLNGYRFVKDAMFEAYREFTRVFDARPEYAFLWKLPGNVSNGDELAKMIILEAEWVPKKCIALGGARYD